MKQCVCVCVRALPPTTGDEGLQQLLLAQAGVHLHPHHVTAEPPGLLLPLANTEGRGVDTGRGETGARCHGNKRKSTTTTMRREKWSEEENINEQEGLFQPRRRVEPRLGWYFYPVTPSQVKCRESGLDQICRDTRMALWERRNIRRRERVRVQQLLLVGAGFIHGVRIMKWYEAH